MTASHTAGEKQQRRWPTGAMLGQADLHIHTNYSDAAPSPTELIDHVATRTDLSVIAVTDHDTIAGARLAQAIASQRGYDVDVVIGEEVSTSQGHIVGLFLQEGIPPGMSALATADAIHEQGGLVFAPHPFFNFFEDRNLTGERKMDGVGRLLESLPLDALEVDNSTPGLGLANLRARRFQRSRRVRLPALGNSDAHVLAAVGKSYTLFPGRSAADLRRAIAEGSCTCATRRYSIPDLATYLAFVYTRYIGRGYTGHETPQPTLAA